MCSSDEENLWEGIFEADSLESTSGISAFFEKQCRGIEQSSGSKVHGRFKKLEFAKLHRAYLRSLTRFRSQR